MRDRQRTVVVIEDDEPVNPSPGPSRPRMTARDVLGLLLKSSEPRSMKQVQNEFGVSRAWAILIVRVSRSPRLAKMVVDGTISLRAAETQLAMSRRKTPAALTRGVTQVGSAEFRAGVRNCIVWLAEDGFLTPELEADLLAAIPAK